MLSFTRSIGVRLWCLALGLVALLAARYRRQAPVDPFSACTARFAKHPGRLRLRLLLLRGHVPEEPVGRRRPHFRAADRRAAERTSGCRSPTATSIARAIPPAPRRSIASRPTASRPAVMPKASSWRAATFATSSFPKAASTTRRVRPCASSRSGGRRQIPLLKARAWTLEATAVTDSGGDLSRAYRLLKQTEGAIFPEGPYRLKRSTLNRLASRRFDSAGSTRRLVFSSGSTSSPPQKAKRWRAPTRSTTSSIPRCRKRACCRRSTPTRG